MERAVAYIAAHAARAALRAPSPTPPTPCFARLSRPAASKRSEKKTPKKPKKNHGKRSKHLQKRGPAFIHLEAISHVRDLPQASKRLYARSSKGQPGCAPWSTATRHAAAMALNAAAFTPCPGKVESPAQYKPGTLVVLNGMLSMPEGLRAGMGP